MMTCYVVHRYITQGVIEWDSEVRVSKYAADIKGTSANLQPGDFLCVMDLMYGMMLPSGNDAAQVLAEFVGKRIHSGTGNSFAFINTFVAEMNRFAKHMQLTDTIYVNAHGLRAGNKSSAQDLSLLASYMMSEPELEEICNTKSY